MLKVFITGANGQVGWELQRTAPEGVDVIAINSNELDITHREQVEQLFALHKPDWIINAAAYTAVDKAEEEPEKAHAVNATGAENLALSAKAHNARMIQISTDFVFDGTQSTHYKPGDTPNPINVYGKTKWEGEKAVQQALGDKAIIVRTSWVYSSHGNNFVKTMLRLMQERDELGIVSDQIGTPTYAKGLAEFLWLLTRKEKVKGIYHYSDAGVASWYDFAVAIMEEGFASGKLEKLLNIVPICSSQYPTSAQRPSCSVLDRTVILKEIGVESVHWRDALRCMLSEMA